MVCNIVETGVAMLRKKYLQKTLIILATIPIKAMIIIEILSTACGC